MNAFHAERRTRATEESYLTDRIAQAVEKLGSERVVWKDNKQSSEPNLEVRMGALYLLERIAKDSPRDHVPVTETICAYMRENASNRPHIDRSDATHENELAAARRSENQALGAGCKRQGGLPDLCCPARRCAGRSDHFGAPQCKMLSNLETKEKYVLDLRGVQLDRIDWSNANLANAIMDGASLNESVFVC